MKYNHLIYTIIVGVFPSFIATESPTFAELSDNYIPLYTIDEEGDSISELPDYYIGTEEITLTRGCSTSANSYQLLLPTAEGLQGQVLGLADNNGTLTWLTTLTNSNQLSLIYNATSNNIPLTLVLRDSTGSFAAEQITAQNFVALNTTNQLTLGSGQTITLNAPTPAASVTYTIPDTGTNSQFVMTDGAQTISGLKTFNNTVNIAAENVLEFFDATNTNLVGLQAPLSVATTYTLSFPATVPGPGQFLVTSTVAPFTALNWGNIGSPSAQTIYVATNGSDITGDGSFSNPYASLKKALSVANMLATPTHPIQITIGAGIFIEDNSTSPLTVNPVTPGGLINIVGASTATTVLKGNTPSKNFLALPVSTSLRAFTITLNNPLASGIGIVATGAGNNSLFIQIKVQACGQGFNLSGGPTSVYFFEGSAVTACGTGITINNAHALIYYHTFVGTTNPPITSPLFPGLIVTGSASSVAIESPSILYCTTGLQCSGTAVLQVVGGSFSNNNNAIQCDTQSQTTLNGIIFAFNNNSNINAQDLNTTVQATSCNINGLTSTGSRVGTGLKATNGAIVNIASSSFNNLFDGIITGSPTDGNPATLLATGVTIQNSSGQDIIQNASSTIAFSGGAFSDGKLTINTPGNAIFNAADVDSSYATLIGKFVDQTQDIIIVGTSENNPPELTYQHDYNGATGLVFINQTGDKTVFGVETTTANDAQLSAVTVQNTQASSVQLYSGNIGNVPGSPPAGNINILGWELKKTGAPTTIPAAALTANFMNNDLSVSSTISQYTSFYVDGFANTFNFPAVNTTYLPTYTTTRLIWGQDTPVSTNLYRSLTNVLQTDAHFAIGTLAPSAGGVALTAILNGATNPGYQIQQSPTTATELGYVHNVTGPIQMQLDSKLNTSGGALTGPLTLPQSTSPYPPLNFGTAPGSTTGLAAPLGVLTLLTSGSPRLLIDANGGITMNAAIGETTLTVTGGGASISGNLLIQPGSGKIITDVITINNPPVNPTDGTNKAYVDSVATGLQPKGSCDVVDVMSTATSGFPIIDSVSTSTGFRVLLTQETDGVLNGIWQINTNGVWSRPNDFASGSNAHGAYTLITSGSVYTNSSWICTNTVGFDIVDVDPLFWTLFSSPQNVTAANIGTTYPGGIFAQKVGNVLQFKSLNAGSGNISLTTNATDIFIDLSPNPSVSSLTASGNIVSTGGTVQGVTLSDGAGTIITGGTVNTTNVVAGNGTAANPSISFISSSTTGLFSPSTNTLAISTAGVNRLQINGSGIINIPGFIGSDGVVHSTSGNLSSSLLAPADFGVNSVPNSALQTLTAPGLVANSATSATSSNILNTIVLRDSLTGGFYAGIVTVTTLLASDGSDTVPSISFANHPAAGLSSPSTGQLNLISGTGSSARSQIILTNGLNIQLPLLTASLPLQLNASNNITSQAINLASSQVTGMLPIANGGTNSGTALNNNRIMVSSGGAIVESAALSNGQILIGSTGAAPVVANITQNSPNQVIVTNGPGSITLSTPQNIDTNANVQFRTAFLNGPSNQLILGTGNNVTLDAQSLTQSHTFYFPDVTSTSTFVIVDGAQTINGLKTFNNTVNLAAQNQIDFYDAANAHFVGLHAPTNITSNYTLQLPIAQGGVNQVLANDGSGNLSWITTTTNAAQLNLLNTATSADIPNTLVLRDNTGSFAATNVTVTGAVQYQSNNSNNVSIAAAANSASYNLRLPIAQSGVNQVLANDGSGNLSWITTVTNATQLNLLNTATSCDTPLTLVLRDSTGSFGATTITLTGNSLINFNTDGSCSSGSGYIWAPKNQNTLIGLNAGNSNKLTGTSNVALGFNALSKITTASDNIAIGTNALLSVTTAGQLTAIGSGALQNNTSGSQNVAVGYQALNALTTGTANSAVGYKALANATTSHNNVAIGNNAMMSSTIGDDNTAVGNNALANNTNNQNTALGSGSMQSNTSGNQNTAVGYQALNANKTGAANIALGYQALPNTTNGSSNIAIGYQAMPAGTIGSNNIALGNQALIGPTSGTSTGSYNIGIGQLALGNTSYSASSGNFNIGIGAETLAFINNGNNNIAVGHNAGDALALNSSNNTIVGYYAVSIPGVGSIISSASNNTIVGAQIASTGVYYANNNTIMGYGAAQQLVNGNNNAVLGYQALQNNISGNDNTAIGTNALLNTTTAWSTAIGSNALANLQNGIQNTAVGYYSLNNLITGTVNTALGYYAGYLSTGSNNIYIGANVTGNTNDNNVISIGIQNASTSGTYIGGIYGVTPPGIDSFVTINSSGQLGSTPSSLLSTLTTATSCDTPLTLVLRDNTGSLAATTITLTGNTLINYSSVGGCDIGSSFIFAPTKQNTIIGLGAGNSNTLTGTSNIALGYYALQNISTGLDNIAIGAHALQNITGGPYSAPFSPGSENIAIGTGALASSQIDAVNIAIGSQAMGNANGSGTGSANIAIGYQPLLNNQGHANIALGHQTMISNTQGNFNVGIGFFALQNNTTGVNNTAVGTLALGGNQTGSNNSVLGYDAQVSTNAQYQTAIGAGSASIIDNSVMLGNSSLVSVMPGSNRLASLGYKDPLNAADRLWATVHTVTARFYDSSTPGNLNASFSTPSNLTNSYDMLLPFNQGSAGQVLSTNGANPAQLSWITTITSQQTLNLLNTVTSCDTPLTLVLRDNTGSFVATTITLTGNSLINYSSVGGCDIGSGFVFAPTNFNTLIGLNAGNNNTLSGVNNSAFGYNALNANTTGTGNTALGYYALTALTTGSNNTVIGANSGTAVTSGSNNIYLGNSINPANENNAIRIGTQGTQTSAYVAGIYNNLLIGEPVVITSSGQLGVGSTSNLINTATACDIPLTLVLRDSTGSFSATTVTLTGNSLINYSTVGGCDIGSGFIFAPKNNNTLIGLNAGNNNTLTGTSNVALGYQALAKNTTAFDNVAIGFNTLAANTVGSDNTAVGTNSLSLTTTKQLTAVGSGALQNNTSGIQNTAVGYQALNLNTTGTSNIAIGYKALANAQTVNNFDNIAIGAFSLTGTAVLGDNIAIGVNALSGVNYNQGQQIAIGTGALQNNTVGTNNTAVGYQALSANTTGGSNTALGYQALQANTGAGTLNTAVGALASFNNTNGARNTALGYGTLFTNLTGNDCVALGYQALNLNTASQITAIGSGALQNNTTGIQNTAVGYQALNLNTTGTSNVALGYQALASANTINNFDNIAIGAFALNGASILGDNIAIGVNALSASGNTQGQQIAIGSNALQNNTTGIQNNAIGYHALQANTTGTSNVALGYQALANAKTINNFDNIAIGAFTLTGTAVLGDNIAIGVNALSGVNYNQGQQIAIGTGALQNNTIGTQNTAVGYYALQANTTGGSNTAFGSQALNANTGAGTLNTAVGALASFSNTSGVRNTALGYGTLFTNLTGSDSVALGYQALNANTASQITAIGSGALQKNTIGTNNTAVGYQALLTNTGGGSNTAVGYQALSNLNGNVNNNNGTNNTAIGKSALNGSGVFGDSTAVGANALANNTANQMTAVGSGALQNNTTGAFNIAAGYQALNANTTGAANAAFGYKTLNTNITGTSNVAIGSNALSVSTGSNNVAIGSNASVANGSATDNIAIGANALQGNTIGTNIGIGTGVLAANTTGAQNVAIGHQAFSLTTGSDNIAIGYQAALNNQASNDVAIGAFALQSDTNGNNVAIGYQASQNNAAAGNMVAIGYQAGQSNTNGTNSTLVGYKASGGSGGLSNTIVGASAASGASFASNNNVIVGASSGTALTTGGSNVIIGENAGNKLTSGVNNIIIGTGVHSGSTANNISNSIIIGDPNSGFTAGTSGAIQIGFWNNGAPGSDTQCWLDGIYNIGSTATPVYITSGGQLQAPTSSRRYKENIISINDDTTQKIFKLNPVRFNYIKDESKTIEYGLIAEEVEKLLPELVVRDKSGQADSLKYSFLPILMLNEQQKDHAELLQYKQRTQALEAQISTMQQQIADLQAKIEKLIS